MRVVDLDKRTCLSTTVYDPYPTRTKPTELPLAERQIPLLFKCDECQTDVSFKTSDIEKHCNSHFTNLSHEIDSQFADFIRSNSLNDLSFLDFCCPTCNQPVKILFHCGPSGFWGEFFFEIKSVLVLKS